MQTVKNWALRAIGNKYIRIRISFGIWALILCCSSARGSSPEDVLIGVWGTEQVLGPLARGTLTIDSRSPEWRASLAGYVLPVERKRGEIQVNLPGDFGELRAHVALDGGAIVGHWIQPATTLYNNRYASPVWLRRLSEGIWTGQIVPLNEPVSFYVSVQSRSDRSLIAFIRNPEFNFFRRHVYQVQMNADVVTFSENGETIRGAYSAQSDTLTLPLLESTPPLRLTRRKDYNAIGFYPRVLPPAHGYVYRRPEKESDGWLTASLTEVNLDEKWLARLIDQILLAPAKDNRLPVQSLLIARHGRLAMEEYFYGFDRERAHDTRSAGKTWATMLVGAARQHGAKLGPETRIYDLFPNYRPFANSDDRKAKITLGDLMTMTSGLACDDGDDKSPGNEDRMQSQKAQLNWYRYTLDLPIARDPGGQHAIYCSAGLNLAGGVVQQATGKWLPDIFLQDFAEPMQISEYHLNLTPTADAYMGGGLYMRPRDLLKLGQLYLNEGVWNGHRVVSKEWVDVSTQYHSHLDPYFSVEHQYGYGWHIYHLAVDNHSYKMYGAGGNGGQLVLVIPDLDMVVGFTGGAYGEFQKWYTWQTQLVPEYIIRSALP